MAESKKMPKMSEVEYEKLEDVQKMYIKRLERGNRERAKVLVSNRGTRRFWGSILVASVFGIYFYTMFAVKQERLGEEYDQRYGDQLAKTNVIDSSERKEE